MSSPTEHAGVDGDRPPAPSSRLHLFLLLMVAVFLVVIAAGVVWFVFRVTEQTSAGIHVNVAAHTRTIASDLGRQATHLRQATEALAGLPEIALYLERPGEQDLEEVNRFLDLFRASFRADVCYLLTDRGVTVASSNRDAPDSFVGKDYSFRPYFIRSMAGKTAFFSAVGVTSGRRGIYFSQPVKSRTGQPAGVAVIKVGVEAFESAFSDFDFGKTLLVDENGIIFLGSDSGLDLKSLRAADSDWLAELAGTRRYGSVAPSWSGIDVEGNEAVDSTDGTAFRLHQVPVPSLPGWWVVTLHDLENLRGPVIAELNRFRNNVWILALLTACGVFGLLFVATKREVRLRETIAIRLSETEDRLRLVASSSADAFVSTDDAGRVEFWSPSAEALFGYTAEEARGMSVERLLPEELRGPFRQGLERLKPPVEGLILGNPIETSGLNRRGEQFPAEVSLMGWLDGQRQCFTAVVRDFTDRKRERDRLATIAAELRSALAEVRTLSGLLPICASCKKIRDDGGSWNQIEVYVRDRTDAEFSHGLCPDCQRSFFPGAKGPGAG